MLLIIGHVAFDYDKIHTVDQQTNHDENVITPHLFVVNNILTEKKSFSSFLKHFWNYLNYGKWRFAIIFPSLLVFLYLIYFAFIYKSSPSLGNVDASYWSDPRQWAFRILLGLIDIGLVGLFIYRFYKRKLATREAALIITGLAMSVIVAYSFGTPIYDFGMVWNQHDIYYGASSNSDYGSGHFGLIMTIFKTGKIPAILQDSSGQYLFDFSSVVERYQPKTFYFVSAGFMKFNSLFVHSGDGIVSIYGSTAYGLTQTDWALFESLRILYCFMELVQMYFIYKIFERLRFKGKALIVAYGVAVFTPIWCYFANWVNNDGMSSFFSVLSVYFLLGYMKKKNWANAIGLAASIGLSMSCKLGGALMALVALPFLIYVFVLSFRNKTTKRVILQGFVFALVVFPLGLGWPLYNYFKFGQPILFFSPVDNQYLYITNTSFFDRFIWYPNSDVFRMIYVYHSNGDAPMYFQDTSLITALLKTSFYGEYGFGRSEVQLFLIYLFGSLLFLSAIVAVPYLLIKAIFIRKKPLDLERNLFLILLLVVMYGWAVWFVTKYPYTCNEDIRYVPLLVLPVSGALGILIEALEEPSKGKWIGTKRIFRDFVLGFSACFALSVIVSYLTLSAWYYRG